MPPDGETKTSGQMMKGAIQSEEAVLLNPRGGG